MLYLFDRFEFDDRKGNLSCDGTALKARPKAVELLRQLIRKRGKVVLRAELTENLWPGISVGQTSLSTLLNETRQLLADAEGETYRVETRGTVDIKGKGPMTTFWLQG